MRHGDFTTKSRTYTKERKQGSVIFVLFVVKNWVAEAYPTRVFIFANFLSGERSREFVPTPIAGIRGRGETPPRAEPRFRLQG